ncbi:unnamed protein product [Albugo candida]|uniref:SAC3/GANP/THP3 conserved domain-containing protein n=1 Tax=Albugo candida TaxID=65357 RepID=A0A024G0W2_9STRA|nr:unnamed protein product [Albugo candida]|eukprot:CCI39940.1 unnamed protein product [Albugo candida]
MFGNNGQSFQGNTTDNFANSPFILRNHAKNPSPSPPIFNANPFAAQKAPSEPPNVQFPTAAPFTSNPITCSQDYKPPQIAAFSANNSAPVSIFPANPSATNPFATSTWNSSSSFASFAPQAVNQKAIASESDINPFALVSTTTASSNTFFSGAQTATSQQSFSLPSNPHTQFSLSTPSITTTFGFGHEKSSNKKSVENENRMRENTTEKSNRTRIPFRRKNEGATNMTGNEEFGQNQVAHSFPPFESGYLTPHKRPSFQQKAISNSSKKSNLSASSTVSSTNDRLSNPTLRHVLDDSLSSAVVMSNTQMDRKAELSSATNLDGLCVDKCSLTERELHLRVDELSVFEKSMPSNPKSPQDLIVKRFQRSSADHKLDIPQEVRPPGVLRLTQLYLEQEIMDREILGSDARFDPPRAPEPIELYNFCWDRTRMIRKDFTLQNYRGAGGRVNPIVLDVHERIARYHIMCEHELCQVSSFVAQQNMEQLGQTLKSLNELYDEAFKTGDVRQQSPFEPELRAYFILCTLDNGRGLDVLKFVKGLSSTVMNSRHVQFAMKVFVARHTDDYYLFFQLFKQATFLQACLLFRFIASMRSCTLQRMNRAYRNYTYPLADLAELLCFDDIDQAAEVCRHHGLIISNHTSRDNIASTEEEDMDEQEMEETNDLAMIRFGGEFETDIELHRKKTPLEVRMSEKYISEKQRTYLRRDICRGVTEYSSHEYPYLSDLVEELEREERTRLYPGRKQYADGYSRFRDYRVSPPWTAQGTKNGNADGTQKAARAESDSSNDLARIASRHAEIENQRKLAIERLQQLQREKELAEARKREQEMTRLVTEMETQQVKLKKQKNALEEKERQEADRLAGLKEIEEKKRQDQIQREMDKEAEKRKRDEIEWRNREQERLRRAEEETKRRNERMSRIKLYQAKLDREKREKQLEVERQLAAKRKEEARARKQHLAIIRFRFHLWKKYRLRARKGPKQPLRLTLDMIPKSIDSSGIVPSFIRASRSTHGFKNHAVEELRVIPWEPVNLACHLGRILSSKYPLASQIGWKLVVADMMDPHASSFGSWCALMCGISGDPQMSHAASYDIRHTQTQTGQHIMTCARLIHADALNDTETKNAFLGTSTVIFPLDLQSVSDNHKMGRMAMWKKRVAASLAALEPYTQTNVVVLLFSSGQKREESSDVHVFCDQMQRRYHGTVQDITCHSIHENGEPVGNRTYEEEFERILRKSVMECENMGEESMEAISLQSLLTFVLEQFMKHSLTRGYKMQVDFQRITSELCIFWEEDVNANANIKPCAPELFPFICEDDADGRYNCPYTRESLNEIKAHFYKLTHTQIEIDVETLIGKSIAQAHDLVVIKCMEWADRLFSMHGNSLFIHNLKNSIRIGLQIVKPIQRNVIVTNESHAIRILENLLPWDVFGNVYSVYSETIPEECTLYISSKCKRRVEALLASRKLELDIEEWRASQRNKTTDKLIKRKTPIQPTQSAHSAKKAKDQSSMRLAQTYRRFLCIEIERGT